MGKLTELAERCEKAAGPERELDADIAATVHVKQLTYESPEWIKDPEFTASIDAAMTLVPEGWEANLSFGPGFNRVYLVNTKTQATCGGNLVSTPALALCAAALRARTQNTPDSQKGESDAN